jgi:hypothetical protein
MSFISILSHAVSQRAAPSHLDEIFLKYTEELAQEEYFQEVMKTKTCKVSLNKIKVKSQLNKRNRTKRAENLKKFEEESKHSENLTQEKLIVNSPSFDELNEMERLLDSMINQNNSELSYENSEDQSNNLKDKYSLAINFIEKYQ